MVLKPVLVKSVLVKSVLETVMKSLGLPRCCCIEWKAAGRHAVIWSIEVVVVGASVTAQLDRERCGPRTKPFEVWR